MNNAQKPTSNGSSESFQAQSVEEKQTKPSGIRKEDKAINDDHELISDEDKCRNNWSKGVQSTEDFFAGKGHPKKESKTENTTFPQNDQNTKTEQLKDIETKSTDTPKSSTKLNKPTKNPISKVAEEPTTPRVPQGDCVVCDRSARALCSGII